MPDPTTSRARPARRATLALSVLVALAALPALVAASTTEELLTLATSTYGMNCAAPSGGQVECTSSTRVPPTNRRVLIRPANGAEQELYTYVYPLTGTLPLDETSMLLMIDFHTTACGGSSKVDAFVRQVGALTKAQDLGPVTAGNCTLTGSLNTPQSALSFYLVGSNVLPPPTPGPPTATPKPTATPTATPKPTPKVTTPPATHTATPIPTTVAPASAAASTSPVPSPSSSAAASATAGASPSVAPAATAGAPSPSPAAGGEGSAVPTATASEAPGEVAAPGPSQPTWEESVAGIADVNADGGAIFGSLLVALLLLLLIGFIGELFNNTVEANYSEIAGWFRKGPLGRVRGALDRIRIDPPGRPGILVFIGLTALISSFVDPGFGFNIRSIAVFLGFLVGLIVVLASFKLPPMLARRRRTGELGQLRPLPWALVIAALFVLISRLVQLQPGYLYGIVLGAIFVSEASERDEGRETFWGSLWTLAAAILAWAALTWLRGLGLPPDGFGVTLLSTAFAATLVAGLEAAAFALMPLRFLPGYVLYKWNRPVWAILWGVSLFAFLHILIGPASGYVSELSPAGFVAALGVFAAFGALSIGTWLYFRFRRPPVPGSAEPA